ncbi:multicopper oxidase domain-containing protein [Halobacillus litoralis]|uniref:multicopper oxidase domain-containing protein n=1 Tax=Halobacillus litoralis TaxID=45668 RepID=UPI00273FF3A2|nr:multicopper oxidase domain-containing protein [Halobacillus litoralis]WLR48011.1 multicopper oxidase domain-containing protein [Halobacillus litoralis]
MNRMWFGSFMILALIAIGVWVFFQSPFMDQKSSRELNTSEEGTSILEIQPIEAGSRPTKQFELTAEETEWEIQKGESVQAWTYNGKVPGESLRVEEGDLVQVELHNELDVPVTIHWHGVILPNRMDGVPGGDPGCRRTGRVLYL